jgi:hypothetical protein
MMVKHEKRAQRFPKRRANTYSDERERSNPTLIHNFVGRSREASAFPSIVANAGGGRVVQTHPGKLGVVEEEEDEAAHAANVCVVACKCMRHT